MATQTYDDTPAAGGNEMAPEAAPVPCLHIYKLADGSFVVKRDEKPPPEDAEPVGSTQEVMAMVEGLGTDQGAEEDAMSAAKAGYARRSSRPELTAPGGVFGE